jgi:uncharacterized damage-inducible protein DinB
MEWLINSLIRARNSTINRVNDLTEEQLDLHSADKITIRDIAWHIAKCDIAAIRPFEPDIEFDDRIYPGLSSGKNKEEVLEFLDKQLKIKCNIISMNLSKLGDKTRHMSYGEITIGEVVMCSGIDHEAHHRGQIALLRKDNGI